jgi:fatty acid desaturase
MPLSPTNAKKFQRQNLLITGLQLTAWWAAIEFCHSNAAIEAKVAIAVGFVLMMQGVFSMMHECIHNNGHDNSMVNFALGAISGFMFGTSYTLFRVNHEGHHVRNRTRPEVAEYIYPGENKFWKTVKYYFAVLGGIWLGSFAALFVLPLIPFKFAHKLSLSATSMNGYSLSFLHYKIKDWWLQRLDCTLVIGLWCAAFFMFDWRWQVLVPLYLFFAFSWSSLQWIYHLRTPLHRIEGAYNLRAPTVVRWLFLNFNYNLTHHRHPDMPWQEMHKITNLAETQPIWARYIGVVKPPEPLPADISSIQKTYF